VTPVYKLSASSVTGRTNYGSMLAGNPVFVDTAFESIATVSVGGGGAADVEFTSIPATYTHLQIRGIARADGNSATIQFNSDTGSNYAYHGFFGDGSSVAAASGTSQTKSDIMITASGANIFSATVLDILDYANTNKYKTTRSLSGTDANGSGFLAPYSGLWMNTNAITSIKLTPYAGNFAQYSHFALYGIKEA
jgi:hypothetical protein